MNDEINISLLNLPCLKKYLKTSIPKKDEKTIKLPFSIQNVYNFQENMNAKAAQINSIDGEPFQTQNKKTIEARSNNYSNLIMNEIQSEKYQNEEIQHYEDEENDQ